MSFTPESITNLKEQVSIVDVIGKTVKLTKKGSSFKGLCPFHNEKTASFSVDENKQMFYCFGCHASGDSIEFVKKYYNLDFNEAVNRIASEFGVQMEETSFRGENSDKYYRINKDAAKFFYDKFTKSSNKGYAYMKSRGVDPEIMVKFGIGYADEEWNSLYKHLKDLGHAEKDMLDLGLISESKGKFYDRFRNRVMFPIINTAGKVIGFGGRAINKDDIPKYLNSPESVIFKKKNNLYGLNLTRNAVSKNGYMILVEGYMDVIGLFQGGIENVGASLGTALTDSQARMIKRYAKKVILSYDADNAGKAAALRGMEILKKEGCDVYIMHVTDGKDPDEFIKREGKNAFLKLVNKAKSYGDYKIDSAVRGLDLTDYEDKIRAMERIAEVLKTMSPAEQEVYSDKAAKMYNLSKMALLSEMNGIKSRENESRHLPREGSDKNKAKPTLVEADLIRLITKNESYIEKIKNEENLITTEIGKNILLALEADAGEGLLDVNRVIDSLEEPERGVLMEIMDSVIISGDEEAVYRDCLRRARLEKFIQEAKYIDSVLQTLNEEETEDVNRLMQRKMELQALISKERNE